MKMIIKSNARIRVNAYGKVNVLTKSNFFGKVKHSDKS